MISKSTFTFGAFYIAFVFSKFHYESFRRRLAHLSGHRLPRWSRPIYDFVPVITKFTRRTSHITLESAKRITIKLRSVGQIKVSRGHLQSLSAGCSSLRLWLAHLSGHHSPRWSIHDFVPVITKSSFNRIYEYSGVISTSLRRIKPLFLYGDKNFGLVSHFYGQTVWKVGPMQMLRLCHE